MTSHNDETPSGDPEPVIRSFEMGLQNKLILGLLTILPLGVVWFVLSFLVDFLSWLGRPAVDAIFAWSGWQEHDRSGWLSNATVLTALAVIVAVLIIYIVGEIASNVFGRRLIDYFNRQINRVPLVRQVYSATQKLIGSLTSKPGGGQRVVLLPFPNDQLRAIGLVTKTFTNATTGDEMAAVYVPTSPNPTSGYLEIVPLASCVETDLSVDQAMNMILSGGATAPDVMRMGPPSA